jgi:hypothetical protein
MTTDIGPGDVVEALIACDHWLYSFPASTRATVGELNLRRCDCCGYPFGLVLVEYPLNVGGWCARHWRKIGGSKADTVRRFAEDLNPVLEPV